MSSNVGKYGPEKLQMWTLFTRWNSNEIICNENATLKIIRTTDFRIFLASIPQGRRGSKFKNTFLISWETEEHTFFNNEEFMSFRKKYVKLHAKGIFNELSEIFQNVLLDVIVTIVARKNRNTKKNILSFSLGFLVFQFASWYGFPSTHLNTPS